MEKRIGLVFIFLLIVLLSSFVLAQDLNEEEKINGETRFTAPELFEDSGFEGPSVLITNNLEGDVGQDIEVENSEGGLGSEKGESSNWLFYIVIIVVVVVLGIAIWSWRRKRIY